MDNREKLFNDYCNLECELRNFNIIISIINYDNFSFLFTLNNKFRDIPFNLIHIYENDFNAIDKNIMNLINGYIELSKKLISDNSNWKGKRKWKN